MRGLWLVPLVVLVLLAAAPARACGCGVALLADVTRERALVIDRPGREEIIASFDLQPDGAGRPAIVLPVPSDPEVEEITTGDPLFYLDIATTARTASGGGDDAAAGAVDVIGREVIGGYDVARLRADDAGALDDWLADNGYTLPEGAEPILADYVDEDWRFVAIRLAPGAGGSLRPLRIAFDTDEPVYPMRLSQLASVPIDLTLYVLSSAERTVEGLDVAYAGRVAELDPPPPPDVAGVLRGGRYLTKLTASGADPARFTDDLLIEGANGGSPGWGPPMSALLALLGAGLLFTSRRA